MRVNLCVGALLVVGLCGAAHAGTDPQVVDAFPSLTFNNIIDIQDPLDGTDRIAVAEQGGRVFIFDNDEAADTTELLLDLSALITPDDPGLMGIAFHPDFENNNFLFATYTVGDPVVSTLSRFDVGGSAGGEAAEGTELVLLTVDQNNTAHNIDQLQFRPSDGFLYVSIGDGGGAGTGQDLTNLLGTIIRIDVDNPDAGLNYGIPDDNPFADNTKGFREEIWAWGFRNPWRHSFDERDKHWVGDVGNSSIEEIDWVEPNRNYGWRIMEGSECHDPDTGCDTSGLTLPIWEYTHELPEGGFAITGGHVYNGVACPTLFDRYIYADFISQNIWQIVSGPGGVVQNTTLIPASGLRITAFGKDKDGELLLADYGSNKGVYRFDCGVLPDVSVQITPSLLPPPNGGVYIFRTRVVNNTDTFQSVDLWLDVTDEKGTSRRQRGPFRKVLLPFEVSLSAIMLGGIPGRAPAGIYVQNVYAGDLFPTAEATDGFPILKE